MCLKFSSCLGETFYEQFSFKKSNYLSSYFAILSRAKSCYFVYFKNKQLLKQILLKVNTAYQAGFRVMHPVLNIDVTGIF